MIHFFFFSRPSATFITLKAAPLSSLPLFSPLDVSSFYFRIEIYIYDVHMLDDAGMGPRTTWCLQQRSLRQTAPARFDDAILSNFHAKSSAFGAACGRQLTADISRSQGKMLPPINFQPPQCFWFLWRKIIFQKSRACMFILLLLSHAARWYMILRPFRLSNRQRAARSFICQEIGRLAFSTPKTYAQYFWWRHYILNICSEWLMPMTCQYAAFRAWYEFRALLGYSLLLPHCHWVLRLHCNMITMTFLHIFRRAAAANIGRYCDGNFPFYWQYFAKLSWCISLQSLLLDNALYFICHYWW